MCGISGVYSNKWSAHEKGALVEKMIQLQHHRGPDNAGKFVDERIALGHNRLSLLDLSDHGNQPFADAEHVLVYNGEIYNFKELREELPDRAYSSTSDTEVLFWSLKTLGVNETLLRIKGMFAFAWYERQSGKLFLCRDRLGIKPLIYAIHSGSLLFASELKAIIKTLPFNHDPIKVLYSSVGILEKSRDYTAFKDVKHVPPGSYLEIDNANVEVRKYFDVLELVDEQEYKRLEKLDGKSVVNEFEQLLEASIQKMLVSDADMGCFVSGGIDSSLIAAFATTLRKEVKFFSANVVGPKSEINDAIALSKHLNQPLQVYDFEREFALRDIAKVTYHYDSPVVTHFSSLPFYNVATLAQNSGVKAVLTGEGADELFLGYPDLFLKRYSKAVLWPANILDSIYNRLPGGSAALFKKEAGHGIFGLLEQGAQNFTRQALRREGIEKYSFLGSEERKEAYLTAQMLQEGIVSLLWRNDRMGMISSIESRFPFLDESILKFSLNLPVKHKIGASFKMHNAKHPFLIDKKIVREAGKKRLPKALAYKVKNGFPTFGWRFANWNEQFLKYGVVAEILGVENKRLQDMKSISSNYHFSLLCAVEIWAKLFIEGRSVDEVSTLVKANCIL